MTIITPIMVMVIMMTTNIILIFIMTNNIILIIRPGDKKLVLRAADIRPGENLRADKVSHHPRNQK